MLPLDPFNRARIPGDFSREGRVRLLVEFAQALIAGRPSTRETELFVGGALLAWLEQGGSLERDHFRVQAPRCSRHTPSFLAARMNGDDSSSR